MSTHNNLYTSTADVNQALEGLGSSEKLNPKQKQLHAEFQSIWTSGDRESQFWLWDCAEQACAKIQSKFLGYVLSKAGVNNGKIMERYYGQAHTESQLNILQRQFIDERVRANIAFLETWDRIRQERIRTADELRVISEQVRTALNTKSFLLDEMSQLIARCQTHGFTLLNPEDIKRENADILQHGIELRFKNKKNEKREIWLYGGQGPRIHADMSGWTSHECSTRATEFARQVSDTLSMDATMSGLPISVSPGTSSGSRVGQKRQGDDVGANMLQNMYNVHLSDTPSETA